MQRIISILLSTQKKKIMRKRKMIEAFETIVCTLSLAIFVIFICIAGTCGIVMLKKSSDEEKRISEEHNKTMEELEKEHYRKLRKYGYHIDE